MSDERWRAEWDALRERDKEIEARFADPYGRDNYEFERAKKADPEHVRRLAAFMEARRKQEAESA